MNKLLLVVAAAITGLAVAGTNAYALTCTTPITCTNGVVAAATALTGTTPTNHGVIVGGSGQAVTFLATGTSGQFLKSAGSGADPAMATIVTGDLPTTVLLEADVGAGLSVTSNTLNTQSDEAGFLVDGGAGVLTCGTSTEGKMQVSNTGEVIQFCDGAATPLLSYTAKGDSSGSAKIALALKSATTTVDVSAATAPSNGQCLKATGSTTATWQSCSAAATTDQTYTVSETKILAGTTTAYMSLNGVVSTTESDVAVPVIGTSASTYARLRCRASGSTGGSGIAITMGLAPNSAGDCGTFSYTSKPTVTVTSTTRVGDTSNTLVTGTSENECIVYKLVPSGPTTTDTFVQCSIERS